MAKIMFATLADGTTKFYPITITDAVVHIKGNTQTKLSELIDAIDYSGKADKVSGATSGNFASLDSNGNLADSGKKAADFKTVQTAVSDPSADGNGITFIDSISQNTNGVITPHKKTVQTVSASASGVGGQDGLMTAAMAEKLAGVAAGAEVNVQADWEEVDSSSDAYIANKPTLGTAAAADTTDFDAAGTAVGLIEALDATPSQAAGADGLALSLTQVDGEVTAISGSIAANTYDAYGAAAAVLGESTDSASANTVYGAKKYADSLVAGGIIYQGVVDGSSNPLPSTGYKKGDFYKVAANGTYAGHVAQTGDALIANKDYASGATASADWDLLQGSVAVSSSDADLVIGTLTKIAEVEGVEIKVNQVEDTSKIEAIACADTTEYADVASVFSA